MSICEEDREKDNITTKSIFWLCFVCILWNWTNNWNGTDLMRRARMKCILCKRMSQLSIGRKQQQKCSRIHKNFFKSISWLFFFLFIGQNLKHYILKPYLCCHDLIFLPNRRLLRLIVVGVRFSCVLSACKRLYDKHFFPDYTWYIYVFCFVVFVWVL